MHKIFYKLTTKDNVYYTIYFMRWYYYTIVIKSDLFGAASDPFSANYSSKTVTQHVLFYYSKTPVHDRVFLKVDSITMSDETCTLLDF